MTRWCSGICQHSFQILNACTVSTIRVSELLLDDLCFYCDFCSISFYKLDSRQFASQTNSGITVRNSSLFTTFA